MCLNIRSYICVHIRKYTYIYTFADLCWWKCKYSRTTSPKTTSSTFIFIFHFHSSFSFFIFIFHFHFSFCHRLDVHSIHFFSPHSTFSNLSLSHNVTEKTHRVSYFNLHFSPVHFQNFLCIFNGVPLTLCVSGNTHFAKCERKNITLGVERSFS